MRTRLIKLSLFSFALSLGCLFYGFFIEPKTLKIRNVDIVEPRWTGAPLKIALISDIHIGGWHVSPDRVVEIVKTINKNQPDMVLIAGDFVNSHEKSKDRTAVENALIERGIRAFAQLNAPLGAFAAIGNHDDWYNAVTIRQDLARAKVDVVENANRQIKTKDWNFCLVGLPDYWTGNRSIDAFDTCPKEGDIIAFMHSPDSFKFLPTGTDLALAGHTHGGQINLPFYGRRVTSTAVGSKYAYGKVVHAGIQTFVTAGIGTSILPARFRAPPEIVMITLKAPDEKLVFKH